MGVFVANLSDQFLVSFSELTLLLLLEILCEKIEVCFKRR